MIRLVTMFRLPGWAGDAGAGQFDRYFLEQHAQMDAARLPGLLRLTAGRAIGVPGGGAPPCGGWWRCGSTAWRRPNWR